MPNEVKALFRVSEWLGLNDEAKQEFVETAGDISTRTIASSVSRYDDQYLEHLNTDVFPNEDLIDVLNQLDVDEETIDLFRAGEVPIQETFRTWNEIQYSVNEVLDFTLLLKLVSECSRRTLISGVGSRYRFQKLVYLVNRDLSRQDNSDYIGNQRYRYGLLEKTGFRYSFRKRDSGPFARQLEEDKNRLYASGLIQEQVVDSEGTPEINEGAYRYRIILGQAGELVINRFTNLLSGFDNVILADWEIAIERTVENYATMSLSELYNEISQLKEVREAADRDMLLKGRRMEYDTQPWVTIPQFGVGMNA